jgi:soluble lytic murein transglycosylase
MRIYVHLLRLIPTAALALLGGSSQAANDAAAPYADARQAFREAYAHVTGNPNDSGSSDSEALKSYPLYPYLQAARIREALNGEPTTLAAVDQRASDFLAEYGRQPVARALRHAWLDSLARRSQWAQFLEAYRDSGASDTERCQSFIAKVALGKTTGLAGDISKAWLIPHSLPECDQPFAWLKQNGLLTTALVEERIRLTLDGGSTQGAAFARQLIQQLPPDRAAPLSLWASLLETPQRSIDALVSSPDTRADPVVLLAGWTHLARTDRAGAKERYAKLIRARGLNSQEASPYALALALPLAWDHDDAALDYFKLVATSDLDDPALEWQARAALWAKDWSLVSRTIAALSSTDRLTARWRYWAARAAEQLHDARAQELYESLLADDNYYSAMAAAHLNRTVIPHPEPLPVDSALLATLERNPALERARELFLCGLRPEAAAEWQFGYDALADSARTQTIHLAARWGWYDQAVSVATAQHVFNDYALLYPRPFDAEVRAAARSAQLAPEIVYGVVRQESLYRIDVVSTAGARGLMQLQPDTARRTARYWKRPEPSPADLFDPSINTTLGAGRLRMLLDQFNGQIPLALAGYNAGSNAVLRWLAPQPIDSDVWIENIPYNETRGYVERVLWHSIMFTWLAKDGEAQRTDSWLAPIRPLTHG